MTKNTMNENRCPMVTILQKVLGGKWKIEILYFIVFEDIHRFGELRRQIGGISESSLAKQLRELEAYGILHRHDYQQVPLKVEYTLTGLGRSFIPVMQHLKDWSEEHIEEFSL